MLELTLEHAVKARKAAQKFVDYDYLDKLTDDEKKWLQGFTNSHYANGELHPPKSKRRKEDVARGNAARRDITNHASAVSLEDAGFE